MKDDLTPTEPAAASIGKQVALLLVGKGTKQDAVHPQSFAHIHAAEPLLRSRAVTADDELTHIEDLVARGEYLIAYDRAAAADGSDRWTRPNRLRLGYLRALALARAGSTGRAAAELEALEQIDDELPPALYEDIAVLGARLAKDRVFVADPQHRPALAVEAATGYEVVFERLGRPFACINAATLWLLAGFDDRARTLAQKARHLARIEVTGHTLDAYWAEVTDAEASLVLSDQGRARECLIAAGRLPIRNSGARAATRRQLRVLCSHLGIDPTEFLAPIANPTVLHYTGHSAAAVGAAGSLSDVTLSDVAAEITRWLATRDIGVAYGSLASGADILCAEAILETGADLHVVLPFDTEEFLDLSVRPAAGRWEQRFGRCIEQATSVTVTCDSSYLGDDTLIGFSSSIAMGNAAIHARTLDSDAVQLAVWDRQNHDQPAGTAHDVATWKSTGRRTEIIKVQREAGPTTPTERPANRYTRRPVRAVIFGDVVGFGRLRDDDMIAYAEEILVRFAATMDRCATNITDRNTWGDAIFVAFDDVTAAARCAIAFQNDLAGDDRFSMRMSAHVGVTLALPDAVRQRLGTFGRELTRAARIEPRTPPGEVYTTAAFAALIALQPDCGIVPEYVGNLPSAKHFETIPMYVLKERNAAS